jgi:hypothetical protein
LGKLRCVIEHITYLHVLPLLRPLGLLFSIIENTPRIFHVFHNGKGKPLGDLSQIIFISRFPLFAFLRYNHKLKVHFQSGKENTDR